MPERIMMLALPMPLNLVSDTLRIVNVWHENNCSRVPDGCRVFLAEGGWIDHHAPTRDPDVSQPTP